MVLVGMFAFVAGVVIGVRLGVAGAVWRVRMHFYAKGMNHEAVDRHTRDVLTEPGSPGIETLRRLRAARRREGLLP